MGAIVAVCMFIGVLSASGVLKWLPQVLLKILAALVIVAGLWNTFWYGVQHPAEFWGQARFGLRRPYDHRRFIRIASCNATGYFSQN